MPSYKPTSQHQRPPDPRTARSKRGRWQRYVPVLYGKTLRGLTTCMNPLSVLASCVVAASECQDTNSGSFSASPYGAGLALAGILVLTVILGVAVCRRRRRNAEVRTPLPAPPTQTTDPDRFDESLQLKFRQTTSTRDSRPVCFMVLLTYCHGTLRQPGLAMVEFRIRPVIRVH